MYTNDNYREPEDREDWEPRNPSDWLERDRLSQQLFRRQELNNIEGEGIAIKVYAAWIRLPILLRRQIWREREIAASLYGHMEAWRLIPGFRAIGVGRRDIDGVRQLAGILNTETLLPLETDLLEEYDVPSVLNVDSIIPSERENPEISIVLEYEPAPIQYGFQPPQYGIVPTDTFILTSEDLNIGKSSSNISTLTLQSGDEVDGQNQAGFRTPGTLTAIVSYEGKLEPLLLSASHVLGLINQTVVAYDAKKAISVGQVIDSNSFLDAAIAKLNPPWSVDYRVKGINIIPAPPIMPYSDMPVQLYGNKSGHQIGFLDVVNSIPAGGTSVGVVPHFRATIASQPGDSGALLISGHGTQPAIPSSFLTRQSARYLDSLICSILGLLVAGPSGYVSPCLNPGQPILTRPQTYFTPIIQVLEHFKLQPWVRNI